MRLSNLRLAQKLGLGFSSILLPLLIISATAYFRIGEISEEIQTITVSTYPKTVLINSVVENLGIQAQSLRNLLIEDNSDKIAAEEKIVAQTGAEIKQALAEFESKIATRKGHEMFEKVAEYRTKFVQSREKFTQLLNSGQHDQAKQFLQNDTEPMQAAYVAALHDLNRFQQSLMEQSSLVAGQTTKETRIWIFGMALAGSLLGLLAGSYITRGISQPLAKAVDLAKRVASRDLRTDIEVQGKDEIAELMQSLQEMNHSLRSFVMEIRQGTENIDTASQEIATGNLDLSSRTEQQAGALEETASSMEEINSAVQQSGHNARQANGLAASAASVASEGGAVIKQVVATMAEINTASKKVNEIIAVIDGIAFQTNILALNAAVEAARAGDQGRGFAVVATEVRNLAQRSATAAKEIKNLVTDSVEKVENGSKLVGQAGSTMDNILDSVNRVATIINEITLAGREQEAGIEQVNQAVIELDSMTQQNAALVEQAAAAAASLEQQAGTLANLAATFQLPQQAAVTSSKVRTVIKQAAVSKQAQVGVGNKKRLPNLLTTISEANFA